MTVSIFDTTDNSTIRPDGNATSSIVVLGEAPGAWDKKEGIPFSGPSGNLLFDDILGRAGIRRSDCLVLNRYWEQPKNNKWDNIENPTKYDSQTREIIQAHPRKCIVAVGDKALEFFTGETAITKWRGSVLTNIGWDCPVIPIIHPEDVFRVWTYLPLCRHDANRIRKIADGIDLSDTPRNVINLASELRKNGGSKEEAFLYFRDTLNEYRESPCLAFDIETYQGTITCIGLANTDKSSIVIPLTGAFERDHEVKLLKTLRECLTGPALKVGQNLDYDVQYLAKCFGIGVRNVWIDTMVAHSVMHPEMPHDLATLTSLYTLHPYYKDMRKEAESGNYNELMWEYNGIDCCVTYEIALKLYDEMRQTKTLDFFRNIPMPVTKTLVRMEHKGIRVDPTIRDNRQIELQTEVDNFRNSTTLHGINPNSPKQVLEYLRERLPTRLHNSLKSSDVHTLKLLRPRVDNDNREFIDAVLEVRDRRKTIGTYLGAKAHKDGRIRTSYRTSATDTGRISSSKDVFNKGMNLQNVPSEQRDWFIPDENLIFWEADASQIEARITAWLSQDETYVTAFLDPKRDLHSENAAALFGIPLHTVRETPTGSPYSYRDIGKRATHAMNYKIGPKKLKDLLNEYVPSLKFTLNDARRFIQTFKDRYPGLVQWWIRTTQRLAHTPIVYTPYGRRRVFIPRSRNPKTNAEQQRAAIAFVPQSTAADHINSALVAIEKRLINITDADVLLQVHDSIGGQCAPEDCDIIKSIVCEEMEQPLPLHWQGHKLEVPAEFKNGINWKECK